MFCFAYNLPCYALARLRQHMRGYHVLLILCNLKYIFFIFISFDSESMSMKDYNTEMVDEK